MQVIAHQSPVHTELRAAALCAGGQWLPEMVELAGGCCDMQEPGSPSVPLSWDQVSLAPALQFTKVMP